MKRLAAAALLATAATATACVPPPAPQTCAGRPTLMDDCIARTARRAIDGVGDPEPPPVVPCGHCQVCTAPRPLPPVPVRKARSWWP